MSTVIVPRHDLSLQEIDRLEERLYVHNHTTIGKDDGAGLAFVALDARKQRIGTIAGYTWAGMAEIKQLWVDEAHRHKGIGKALLEAAVGEAAERGCEVAWLMSYSFQAPAFYEKYGFVRIATLLGWPPGHSHIVLQRRLTKIG